jgi:hypothetical protein
MPPSSPSALQHGLLFFKQSPLSLTVVSYFDLHSELNSGPARPQWTGPAASWRRLWSCSQVCAGGSRAAVYKKEFNNSTLSSHWRLHTWHARMLCIPYFFLGLQRSRMDWCGGCQCVTYKRYHMWLGHCCWRNTVQAVPSSVEFQSVLIRLWISLTLWVGCVYWGWLYVCKQWCCNLKWRWVMSLNVLYHKLHQSWCMCAYVYDI